MPSSSDAPELPTGPVQLSGWKEIASYLGRSVRTVQRWEKEFGLPVRRFGASKPESVFALPREVDAWLETAQGVSARSGAGAARPLPHDADASGRAQDAEPGRSPGPRAPRTRVMLVAAAAVIVTVLLVWVARPLIRRPAQSAASAAPAEWRVDFDSLVVSDAMGNVLWTHKFPRELNAGVYQGSRPTPRHVLGGIADLEGDGSREVWFVANPPGEPAETALYLFEQDGRLRWKFKPSLTVRFGADTFGPTWIVDRAFITPDPDGGKGRAVWAVLYDMALFPSSIQRIDPKSGQALSAYWTNGSIVTAALDGASSPPRLLVGACYNETRAGSLSVLDALHPNGSAPAEREKYRCVDCPPGEPLAFLVFPKPARFGPSDVTGPVETITPLANGAVGVRVRHAVADGESPAVAVFTLDSMYAPITVDTADGYLAVYDALVARGKAPAGAPKTIDPEREFLPILRWSPEAKRYVEVFKRR